MKGSRPLLDGEIKLVIETLTDPRDRALFILGIRTGFRISERLSLRVGDVFQYGSITDRVEVQRKSMKKKLESRSVPLHDEAKAVLLHLIQVNGLTENDCLFQCHRGDNKPLGRIQAWRVLNAAYSLVELSGNVSTHSMRKTFAAKVYKAVDKDIIKTQKALGHKNLNSTASYLSFAEEEIDDAILGVA